MNIAEIIDQTEHRPWPLPQKRWKYYQEWNNAVFLHWQVEINELQKLVPKELEIDLFEGKPWVSLVVFRMEKIRPRFLPPFPPISNFDEINIRTYVKKGNKTGVYFLSIEGGKSISCKIAKALSELPYRYSKMKQIHSEFSSRNDQFNDQLLLKYKKDRQLAEKSTLDKWLTERYTLFQDTESALNEFEIHHIEWPIYELEIERLELSYSRFSSILSNEPHRCHYSSGVQVLAWEEIKHNKNR